MASLANNWTPRSQAERDAVQEQLERVLAHPSFKNSKRCHKFLRYVVEYSLQGNCEPPKERTVGIEVFGRPAEYDTQEDTVVRTTAGDVRKRIAQYYHEPGHENQLRIDLPPGCYQPEFHLPMEAAVPVVLPVEVASFYATGTTVTPERKRTGKRLIPLVLGMVSLAVVATFVWLARISGASPSMKATDVTGVMGPVVNLFWKPVLAYPTPPPIVLCVGDSPAPMVESSRDSKNVTLADVFSIARLSEFLTRRDKYLELTAASTTTFETLRRSPVILIGGFDNNWTLRATTALRFYLGHSPDSVWIEDRKNPSSREWSLGKGAAPSEQAENYAIVARFVDSNTQRWTVIAAGLDKRATGAAGDCLIRPECLNDMVARTDRKDWTSKNLEAVISTQVVDGKTGPSKVVAVEVW